MMTARYAGFLQRSLPPFWPTTDKQMVLGALARLDAVAPPPIPVAEPALRTLTGSAPEAAPTQLQPVTEDPGPLEGASTAIGPTPVADSSRSAVTGGHAWTTDQDDELRDAAEAGMQLEELVDHFELPVEAIATRADQLGLTLATGALFD
jgi:ATP-dependent DNA helicase DinG